jgi:hypothetical protein
VNSSTYFAEDPQDLADQVRGRRELDVRAALAVGVAQRDEGVVQQVMLHGALSLPSLVLAESQVHRDLAEALATEVEPVTADDAALAVAA